MGNRWLVKTEPTDYSFADLERDETTRWTGVANPLAKKHLRAMRPGDEVFVYHTGKERQVVGIVEVVREGEEPRFRVRERLKRPVALAEIKARGEFADFELVRNGRLSVMPVSAARWKFIRAIAG